MCGICGIVNFDGRPIDLDLLKKMNNMLYHRGPDEEGYFVNSKFEIRNSKLNVGLGIRRLSIIDLETGSQPIYNEDRSVVVVLNGEIYNFQDLRKELEKRHKFYTRTDVEVVAHLWEDCKEGLLKYLNGMFALALWDERKKILFLARDQLGKKPLFYTRIGNSFYFASEIKSFLAIPEFKKEINLKAIHYFLTYQYIPAPMTIFKSVFKLPAASFFTISSKGIAPAQKYWQLDYSKKMNLTYNEAKEKIRELLKDAVKLRMIADVPLGAFLSGGIDSSIVVGLMSEISSKPVKTFSIGFKEKDYSEVSYARIVANRFKTQHNEFIVEPKYTEILEKIVWHYDEPFGDSSALPSFYVSQITRKFVKVALNGDGGDENFGGYLRYLALKKSQILSLPFRIVPEKLFKAIVNSIPEGRSRTNFFRRGKRFLSALREAPARRNLTWHRIFSNEMKEEIYSDEMKNKFSKIDAEELLEKLFEEAPACTILDRAFYTDFSAYLPECLMTKMDIASMANSLESRSPFLDWRLVEFAASFPSDWKIKGSRQKCILKDAFSDLLPPEILNRGKMGFGVPLDKWFCGQWQGLFRETVLSAKAIKRNYFNISQVRKIFEEHLSGRRVHGYRLWNLLMLELWHRVFVDGDIKNW